MIPDNYKNSLLIARQLPQFIRDDESYQTFVAFIEAYFEWLEQEYNIYDRAKNLLNYKDIDNTLSEFEEYFFNEFLQYFPDESLTDKKLLVKFSKELYQRKGTSASFKFLFRALFNSDCDTFNTRNLMLIASDGKWVISKSVKINTLDSRFLEIDNYKIIGETSKSIAKIEKSQVSGNKIEIFLSDIQREFFSGEYIRIVDNEYNDILINSENLRAKIIGIVPSIILNPNYKGLFYKYGDPIIFYGGLNPEISNPIPAEAIVGDTSLGVIKSLTLNNGGHGYQIFPNSEIIFTSSSGSGANAIITAIDNTSPEFITDVAVDFISPYENIFLNSSTYGFLSNPTANANTALANAFSIISLTTYPISEIELIDSGTNFSSSPTITAKSYYKIGNTNLDISSLGILAPLEIKYKGFYYSNGDVIIITGGSGVGAYANVTNIDANGSIISANYYKIASSLLPNGGMGYDNSNLPTITINSTNNKIIVLSTNNISNSNNNVLYVANTANLKIGMYVNGNNIPLSTTFNRFPSNTIITNLTSNTITLSSRITANVNIGDNYTFDGTAILNVPCILGSGADISADTDSIGEIKTLILLNSGEDYISQPQVSLRIMDVVVSNVNELSLPENQEIIYQGDANAPSFSATIYSITKIPNTLLNVYSLRIFNYSGILDTTNNLYIDRNGLNSKTLSLTINNTFTDSVFTNGTKTFGDGKAKANAEFINGTVTYSGKYLNSDGHPSSYCVLQSDVYNNFTYILSSEQAYIKYENIIKNLLHPGGTQLIPNYLIKSNNNINIDTSSNFKNLVEFKDIVHPYVYATMNVDYDLIPGKLSTEKNELIITENNDLIYVNSSNTIINPFSSSTIFIRNLRKDLTGVGLSSFVFANDYIYLTSNHSENVFSKIISIDDVNDIIKIEDSIILKYSNVAYGYTNSNTIILTSLTGKFNLINNGIYKNEDYLQDIVYVNDYIDIGNNITKTITNIDYINRIIYTDSLLYDSGNVEMPQLISVTRNYTANTIKVDYDIDFYPLVSQDLLFIIDEEHDREIFIPD